MRFTVNKDITREEAEKLLRNQKEKISLDIETVSLENPLPLGVAIAVSPDTGFYFFNPKDQMLKEIIESVDTVIFHNAAFDLPILSKLGITVKNYEDTMLQAYSAGILNKSLEALSSSLLNRDCPSVTTLWRKKIQGNISIDHVKMASMSIIHACNTYALYESIPITTLYKEIDRPCVDLVIEMEKWGVQIDQYRLTEIEQETVSIVSKLEKEIKRELGELNLESNPQVAKALQAKGILGTRKTKTNAMSVSEESLKPLNHPLTNKLLEYRGEMKTLSTYVPAFRNPDSNGRLHTKFGYTNTGRWSSYGPNLQNITRKDEKHQFGLRDCIVAQEGFQLLSLDAKQIEMIVVANLSQDPMLLEACKSTDLHLATATQVFGWTDDEDEMARRRYNAKQLNFAILYGADAFKVAEMAECTIMEAEQLIGQYFDTYKILKVWIDTMKEKAKEDGYVINMFGRIRPIPDLHSGSWKLREDALREAINTVVQGAAVDIVKKMMLYLRGVFPKEVQLVLQVHDEIIWEVPDEWMEETLSQVKELNIAFPIYPVVAKTGMIYGDLKEIEIG